MLSLRGCNMQIQSASSCNNDVVEFFMCAVALVSQSGNNTTREKIHLKQIIDGKKTLATLASFKASHVHYIIHKQSHLYLNRLN